MCSKEWVTLTAPGNPINPSQKNLWLPSTSTFFKALTEIPPIYILDIQVRSRSILRSQTYTLLAAESRISFGMSSALDSGSCLSSEWQAGKQRENLRSRIIIRINQLSAELLLTSSNKCEHLPGGFSQNNGLLWPCPAYEGHPRSWWFTVVEVGLALMKDSGILFLSESLQ